jgi:hypothetical protein
VEPAYGTSARSYGAKQVNAEQPETNAFPHREADDRKIDVDDSEDLDDFFNSL